MNWVDLPFGMGRVTPMTANEVCDWILAPREHGDDGVRVLANLNLHGIYMSYVTDSVRELTHGGHRVVIDGWPVLQLARAGSGNGQKIRRNHRIGSTDWLTELIERDPDIAIVSIGGTPGSATGIVDFVQQRTARLRWISFDGYSFDKQGVLRADQSTLTDALKAADLVLVGMGMPTQEQWILEHKHLISPRAIVANVGGCLDYYSGTQKLAPRWTGTLGVEWLYRLVNSPRRLATRYLVEPFKLAIIVARANLPGGTRREFARAERTAADRIG